MLTAALRGLPVSQSPPAFAEALHRCNASRLSHHLGVGVRSWRELGNCSGPYLRDATATSQQMSSIFRSHQQLLGISSAAYGMSTVGTKLPCAMTAVRGWPADLGSQGSSADLPFSVFFLLVKAAPHQLMRSTYKGALLPKAELTQSKAKVCRKTWEPPAQEFSAVVAIADRSAAAENLEGNHCWGSLQAGGRDLVRL